MIATPTTTVTVFGASSTATDAYGDPVADTLPTAIGVPASILEQTRTVTTANSDRAQVVRIATGRLPADVEVVAGGRLLDEATNNVWLVDSTSQPSNPHTTADVRCDLRRVG